MPERPDQLIDILHLQVHPEGGHFCETFRSPSLVTPDDGRGKRNALTIISYLLQAGEKSRWHRVSSDEIWHFCEGDPLDLYWVVPNGGVLQHETIGPREGDAEPVVVVPAGCWQAARSRGRYSLVSCSVSPGFDFADFEMLNDGSAMADELFDHAPAMRSLP